MTFLFLLTTAYVRSAVSWLEFSCGDVSLPRPEFNINFGPIIAEKRERYPLFAAFGIRRASAGQGTSLHALIQSERDRVHPDGERKDNAHGGGDHVPILLAIRTKYLDISQRLQCRAQGFHDVGMRGQVFDVIEHLAIDAGL